MTENQDSETRPSRLLRSARILRAFFEHKLQTTLELLTEEPTAPLEAGMQFDLQLSSQGIWGLRSSTPLSEKVQSEISSTFHTLIGAVHNLEDRRRSLARLEQKLENHFTETPANNVISIHRALGLRQRSPSAAPDKRWMLRLDCLIESLNPSDIHKMALELHSHSQRYAFLEFHDLNYEVRQNLSELLQLGAVSLFVPSILSLTMNEQYVLRELMQRDTLQRPLLMVGANLTYSELRGEPAIHLEFLALLSRAYIKLSRPFQEYKDKQLIHYFLDSLSQNPT